MWRARHHKRIASCFEREIIVTQDSIENTTIDAYFSKYKLDEVDEYNHGGTNSNYEKSKQLMIESHVITIIITNPDATDFDTNEPINQIYKHVAESIKKTNQSTN